MSLAPLAGYTDSIFRNLISRAGGCGLMHSEMISAEGLCRGNKSALKYLASENSDVPFSIQIFGSDPKTMTKAAKMLEDKGVELIDINMGCPVKKVVKNGAGAALLRSPDLAGEIVSDVVNSISVPVTVKIRSGWSSEDDDIVSTASELERSGASAITVHPRKRSQFFQGKADWSVISLLSSKLKIPVIGNGDILTPEDGLRMFEETGCSGIMIGRAVLCNPFIFSQIKYLKEKGSYQETSKVKMGDFILEHFEKLNSVYNDRRSCILMRGYMSYYTKGFQGGKLLREKLNTILSAKDFIDEVRDFFHGN